LREARSSSEPEGGAREEGSARIEGVDEVREAELDGGEEASGPPPRPPLTERRRSLPSGEAQRYWLAVARSLSAPTRRLAGASGDAEGPEEPIEHLAFFGCGWTALDGPWRGVLVKQAAQGLG